MNHRSMASDEEGGRTPRVKERQNLALQPKAAVTERYRQMACQLAALATSRNNRLCSSRSTEHASPFPSGGDSSKRRNYYGRPRSDELPSQQVSRHMILHHPGYIPISILSETVVSVASSKEDETADGDHLVKKEFDEFKPPAAKSSSTALELQKVVLPCCHECGGALQPGYHGTTVRLKPAPRAATRTQRRRAARQRAKKRSLSLQKKKKKYPPLTTSQSQNQSDPSELWEHKLQPACANVSGNHTGFRNFLTITCGYCGTAARLPGSSTGEESKKKREKHGASLPYQSASTSTPHKVSRHPKKVRPDGKPKDDDDFLPLDNKVPLPSAKRPYQPRRIDTSSRKKRKKRLKSDPLLNFLSSLNDP